MHRFFDFFYYLDDDNKFLYSRVCSRCSLELERRKQIRRDEEVQLAYFPLWLGRDNIQDDIYQRYQIFDSLHFYNFLVLLEKNEYLMDASKMAAKFYIAYLCPFYEKYFVKKQGKPQEDLSSVYEMQRNFLDYKSDYFYDVLSDCYESMINYEKTNFELITDFHDLEETADFLYLACYVRSFFKLREGNKKLESNNYFNQIEKKLKDIIKKC